MNGRKKLSKKVKKIENVSESMRQWIYRHITDLKLENIDKYFEWCGQNGFKKQFNKTNGDFQKERVVRAREKADKILASCKKPEDSVLNFLDNQKECKFSQQITQALEKNPNSKNVIKYLLSVTDCLFEELDSQKHQMIDAVGNLMIYEQSFIRPIESWKPRSHNVVKQFNSLLKHLFAKYEIPTFMNKVWFNKDALAHSWFIHLGTGQNIRLAPKFPVTLTKKQAHYFYQAPDSYDVNSAILFGRVRALGGSVNLVNNLINTRIVLEYSEFWESVVKWFITNPMLDLVHVGPIIDWIYNQKYTPIEVFVERGRPEFRPPPQTGLSMHHRDALSTLNAVNKWHKELGVAKKGINLQWKPCGIRGLRIEEGSEKNRKIWIIRELLSGKELIEEGRKMHHCAASYASSCHKNLKSIWSMTCQTNEGIQNKLTIEVAYQDIVQARGMWNAKAGQQERQIMERWASTSGLRIKEYI